LGELILARLFVAFALIVATLHPAPAQTFPSRPITVVVPFPPGGGLDFLLRTIQPKWEAALGQPMVIENRPGATGNVGNAYVAKADPDGYTLVITATNIGMFPHVFAHLAYDPLKDFTVIGLVGETPGTCIVNPNSKYQSLGTLISEARANPGKLNFGSTGNGSPSQLQTELIAKLNNVKFTHVPYKGSTPVSTDLLGNFIDFTCIALAGPLPLIQEGKLKAIAVATKKRSVLLPDVPTVKELGFGDIDEGSRYILLAPVMTPKPIVDQLRTTLQNILADPGIQKAFMNGGFEVDATTPDQVSAMMQEQFDLWGPFVNELKLKVD
jgi:tripartite-type tricarboxylate transporter receptor subunit TctC